MTTHRNVERTEVVPRGAGVDRPTAAIPRSAAARPPQRGAPVVVPPAEPPVGIRRFASPFLALIAVALLPVAAATTDLAALDGWGFAKVLAPAGWLALLCAIASCLVELWARRPRIPMLAVATGVLVLCSTGMPSVVEPAARFGTAWTIAGFVDAISVGHGVPPTGVDARFFWPAFFAQWAWFRDASGVSQLDVILRWFPPAVVTVWAIGIYALARSMLGGTRAPWVAAWLFVGLNWIEQDYFSPQAFGIVLLLTVLTFVLGPLATRRTDPAGVPGWPAPHPDARRLPVLRRWLAGVMTPPSRPSLPARQVLLVYFCAALCLLAIVPAHQLTPFAILGQLVLLAVCGRFRGRGLVLVGAVAVVTFLLIAGRDFWTSQLGLLLGSGGNALQSGVADRLSGDVGQVDVKYLRIVVPALTYVLGAVGALVYYRRRRDIVPIGLAVVPMAFAAQGYGGEVFLRIVLYGLPILTILGTDALRALVRWKRGLEYVLAIAMVAMFGLLVLIRGGNDSYQAIFPAELAMYRQAVAQTPAGETLSSLSDAGPTGVDGITKLNRPGPHIGCDPAYRDPVNCFDLEHVSVLVIYTSTEKQGVYLNGEAPGWTTRVVRQLVASGKWRIDYQQGYDVILRRNGAAP